MVKVKYYYDPKTISYRKIEAKSSETFKKSILWVLGTMLIAFFGFIGFSQFLMSPKERAQKRELENLKLHYELLSKKMDESSNVLTELQERDNNIYRIYFEASPIPDEQRKAGFGGVNRYTHLDGFDNSEMIKNISKKVDILSKQIVVQSKSLDEIVGLAKEKDKFLASIPAIKPMKKKDARMVSGFGMRMHPILKYWRKHNGMDFAALKGKPIFATGNGIIKKAEYSPTFGKVVYINHGFGYETIYAHMSKFVAKKGQKVKRGDLIGYVGNTGRSIGSHLHYEVHKNGKTVNPLFYFYGDLTPEEFTSMQKASQQKGQSYD